MTEKWRNPISRDCRQFQTCKPLDVVGCPHCPSFEVTTWFECPDGYFFDSSLDEPRCRPAETVDSCDDIDLWEPIPFFLRQLYANGEHYINKCHFSQPS